MVMLGTAEAMGWLKTGYQDAADIIYDVAGHPAGSIVRGAWKPRAEHWRGAPNGALQGEPLYGELVPWFPYVVARRTSAPHATPRGKVRAPLPWRPDGGLSLQDVRTPLS